MRRALKWIGMGLAGIVALALLVILVLPSVINLERYRTLLAQRAGRTLGREVSVGALRLSFWGGIGAEAQGIRIGQAAGFGPEPFLSAEALRVHVHLMPLLRGQIKVSNAVLERPHLRLVRGADGRWSVEDLFKPQGPQASARPPVDTQRTSKVPLFSGLLLSEVVVRHGEITLVDPARAVTNGLILGDVDLTIRQSVPSDPIALKARARLAGSATGQIDASLRIAPSEKDGPSVDGTVSLTDAAAQDWRALVPASGSSSMVSGALSAEVRVSGPLPHSTFAGTLDLTPVSLRLGTAFQKGAGESARVTFQGRRDEVAVRVTAFSIACRDAAVEGTLDIPDVRAPQITFTAAAARLNLDRLLTPPVKQTSSLFGTAWAAPIAHSAAPVPAVPGIDLRGQVSLGELMYRGLTWSGVEVGVRYHGGILELPDIRADFAKGRLRAKGEVDFRPAAPWVAVTSRLEKAATEPLVKALSSGSWTLKSGLDFDGQVEFSGSGLPAILSSALGNGSVQLVSGHVIGYQPLERLTELLTPILAHQGVQVRLNEFDQVSGHYTVDKGFLRTTDLTLTKPEGIITAVGALNLLDSALDFDVVAKFGRSTIEAKVTGTTAHPVIVPKLARLQRHLENELDKALPGGQSQGLKDLFKGLFRR